MAKNGINVYLNGNEKDKLLLKWQKKGAVWLINCYCMTKNKHVFV